MIQILFGPDGIPAGNEEILVLPEDSVVFQQDAFGGNEAFAVESTQYKCNIGDLFENNTFYYLTENGEKIKCDYIPTPEQEIEVLKNEIEIMTEYSLDNDYRLSVMELGL